MSAPQVTNLSLLSRGVGEVQLGNHEKIEVKLEPEDYNNWLDDTRRVWNVPAVLPPIHSTNDPQFHHQREDGGSTEHLPEPETHRSKNYPAASHDSALAKVYLPKTFTTRKGALLLFSEDFANKQFAAGQHNSEKQNASGPELRTVDDLAKSILAYGASKSFKYSEQDAEDSVYLGFVHSRSRKYYERQYKPGFSAKRYLSSWSKLWDYSLLNKLTNKGYIKPQPYQKKSDYDVSGIPLPYRILRQWLYAPGSIDGYTFYRQGKLPGSLSKEDTVVVIEETPRPVSMESEVSQGSIKVTSLLANKELNYGELDSSTKEGILTELLVKSAITHAIKKQKEYQETVSQHFEDEEMKRKASAKLYEFDMMNAIQTALDSSIIPTVSTFNLDPQGLISEEQKMRKDKKGFRGTKGFGLQVSATTSSLGSAGSLRSSFDSKHKVLPPISRVEQKISKPMTLGEHIPATLPAHYEVPPSTVADEDLEYNTWRESVLAAEKPLAPADGSSTLSKQQSVSKVSLDSVDLEHDMDDKKSVISTMSMLSMASKKSKFSSQGVDAPYTKGITSRQDPSSSLLKVDMVAGDFDPTAAITSWRYDIEQEEPYTTHLLAEKEKEAVETRLETTPVMEEEDESVSTVSVPVAQEPPTPDSVPLASEHCTPTPVPSVTESSKTATPPEPEQISESEFMEALTEQAREIAKAVLQQSPEAGHDLAVDVKNAAELLMSNLPDEHSPGASSRTHSQLATESADESASEGTPVVGPDGQTEEADAATVGQLVKEGLEDLVHTVDEYVAGDENTEEELSTQSPSIATATPSVPGTQARTPSIKSSRLSSAQPETATPLQSVTGSGSERSNYANSIPNAEAATPSQSRATKLSAAEANLEGSRGSSTSLSQVMSQRSSVVGHWKAGDTGEAAASADPKKSSEAAAPGSSESKTRRGSGMGGSVPSRKSSSVTTPKKSESKVQHETEFVVGKVADKTELQQLYAPIENPSPPKPKAKAGKAKPIVAKPSPPKKEPVKKAEKAPTKKPAKKKGKEKKAKQPNAPGKASVTSSVEKPVSPVKTPKPPTPVVETKEPTPEPEEEEWKTPEPEEEVDMEFVIVRDEFSDEEEEQKPELGSVKPISYTSESPVPSVGTASTADEDDSLPPGLSNRDAQAAKRAAAKEKRRREVEKRRREREEALKKEKEDAERKERIRLQMEEERLRREEEIRLKKEMEREERERLEREEEARLKAEREAQERERRRQEEKARILEEKRRRMLEEEERRKELQALREAEEAERLRLEQEKLAAMAEEDRIEYLRRQEEEERLRRIAEEEARIRMEEENRRIMAELERKEAERRQAEEILRRRLMFQRSLNVEAHGMDHTQDITRAFVFSYYELLKWLGYEVPAWAQFGPTPSADFIYDNHPVMADTSGADNIGAGAPSGPNATQGHIEH